MSDNTVFKLTHPGTFSDLLTGVLRSEVHALLPQAVEVVASLDSRARAGAQPKCSVAAFLDL